MSSKPDTAPQAVAFNSHDHGRCVRKTAAEVEAACADQNLRLTPIRRRVLEILLEEHRALGAYDVLNRLAEEGQPAHPPVAYRALEFLVSHGFAHKLEKMNAFVACARPGEEHRPVFLICSACNAVAEDTAAGVDAALGQAAGAIGFAIASAAIEAEGLCPSCRGNAAI
jgi:Fur family zinc uptake transcriptional regulator